MIVYALTCAKQHAFEAWFASSAAYDKLAAAKQVSCPECGSHKVAKAPMSPRVARTDRIETAAPAPADKKPEPSPQGKARQFLLAMRKQIEATHDNVGGRFPEEARKIHYGEVPHRPIYGDATPDDARALADEGIDVAPVPWVRDDA